MNQPTDVGLRAENPTDTPRVASRLDPLGLKRFVLSFDFEDWHQLVHRRIGRSDWRDGNEDFDRQVSTLLDLLDELAVTATFFVAGVTAERHPSALAAVAARGHELGCHGYEHRRVYRQTPTEFRLDVLRGVDVVERICGVTPLGYRAPWFSITRDSAWAHQILGEIGFRYDSSLYDSPRIPRRIQPVPSRPYRIQPDPDALWEFPVAVWRWRSFVLPLGGGAYWRALPDVVLWQGLRAVSQSGALPVLYFHPYEFAEKPLRVALPPHASSRERTREAWRRISKNARRGLISQRLREAATRFRLVAVRDVIDVDPDEPDATLLR